MLISFHLSWLRHLGQLMDLSYITPLQKVGLIYLVHFLHFRCNFTLMGESAVCMNLFTGIYSITYMGRP